VAERPGWPEPRSRVIRDAALELFWQRGYHGTSVRQIGKAAGIAVANVYHYYPSKLDLLFEIVEQATDALAVATEQRMAEADDEPGLLLAAVVAAHVRFHVEFQRESFVGTSELRSLSPQLRRLYVAKRDAQQARFARAVQAGIDDGLFTVPHPNEAVIAMVTMCTSVALWYRPDGGLSREEIVDRFVQLSLQMVGVPEVPKGKF
jgi:AcrR family transcriptional regulator